MIAKLNFVTRWGAWGGVICKRMKDETVHQAWNPTNPRSCPSSNDATAPKMSDPMTRTM